MALFSRSTFRKLSSRIFSWNSRIQPIKCTVKPSLQAFYCSKDQMVCSGVNIYKDGQDPPIKPDSEYPDWLWSLKVEKVPIEQLSTDEKGYWRKVRKAKIKQQNALRKQGKLK